jgi:hypothetical protein
MGAAQYVTETTPLPARLVDSALALARAELALVLVHTRELAIRAVTALLATIIAAAFSQTALLLVLLSPFLAQVIAIEALVVAIVLSLGVAFAAGIGALVSWRNVRRTVSVKSREGSLPAGERAFELSSVPSPTRSASSPVEPDQHRAQPTTLAERMS